MSVVAGRTFMSGLYRSNWFYLASVAGSSVPLDTHPTKIALSDRLKNRIFVFSDSLTHQS